MYTYCNMYTLYVSFCKCGSEPFGAQKLLFFGKRSFFTERIFPETKREKFAHWIRSTIRGTTFHSMSTGALDAEFSDCVERIWGIFLGNIGFWDFHQVLLHFQYQNFWEIALRFSTKRYGPIPNVRSGISLQNRGWLYQKFWETQGNSLLEMIIFSSGEN